jgi:hypothetical protein
MDLDRLGQALGRLGREDLLEAGRRTSIGCRITKDLVRLERTGAGNLRPMSQRISRAGCSAFTLSPTPIPKLPILPKCPAPSNFGNNGNFGMRVAEEQSDYAADALRRAEQALLPIDDEAELCIRGELLP